MTTQLTVAARAAVALGSSKAEDELTALALQSKSITAVTSPDGRTECHAAAMTAKAARVGIEKAGKAARDDATQFSKAVIAEEKRLVALIAPEEARLVSMRDEWDSLIAREKSAKAEAERLAIVQIMTRIANIRNIPLLAAASTSNTILDDIERLEALNIDDSFKAYYGEAAEAKAASMEKLRQIYAAKVRAEGEAIRVKQDQEEQFARMKAECEELARRHDEQLAIEAQAKAERDAEFKRLQLIRDEIQATQLLLVAEAEKKAKAEEDQCKERECIQAERIAEEKRASELAAHNELQRLIVEKREAEAKPAPVVELVEDVIFELVRDMKRMTPGEIRQMCHMRDRIFSMRQNEAA